MEVSPADLRGPGTLQVKIDRALVLAGVFPKNAIELLIAERGEALCAELSIAAGNVFVTRGVIDANVAAFAAAHAGDRTLLMRLSLKAQNTKLPEHVRFTQAYGEVVAKRDKVGEIDRLTKRAMSGNSSSSYVRAGNLHSTVGGPGRARRAAGNA